MKKRIRGMTSAWRGEKEEQREHWRRDGPRVEREWQNDALERAREERRVGAVEGSGAGMKRRWAVSRVWQRFRAKEERRRGG